MAKPLAHALSAEKMQIQSSTLSKFANSAKTCKFTQSLKGIQSLCLINVASDTEGWHPNPYSEHKPSENRALYSAKNQNDEELVIPIAMNRLQMSFSRTIPSCHKHYGVSTVSTMAPLSRFVMKNRWQVINQSGDRYKIISSWKSRCVMFL